MFSDIILFLSYVSCIGITQHKKRDRTIAVPLFKALVLPFNPNNNTEAHAVCIYARLHARLIHTNEHLVSQCFGLM